MALGHRTGHTLTARSPAVQAPHHRVQPGFIHEHQVCRIPERLQPQPERPLKTHIRAGLFGGA